MKMKFGVRLPNTGPLADADAILRVAERADALGFDGVSFHDHVSLTREERYHNAGGLAEVVDDRERQGLSVTDVYEGMVTLAVVAGRTTNVRLIPSAFVFPWRHPVLFAKQIVTLHELSNRRVVCCVAIGNVESDFKAMSVSPKIRGRLMDEHLAVLSGLFQRGEMTYHGDYLHIEEARISPRPHDLPVWIAGGFGPPSYRRVANYAQGFYPFGTPAEFRRNLPTLDKYLRSYGRRLEDIELAGQTFLCIEENGGEALRRCRYTVEAFYSSRTLTEQAEARAARAQRSMETAFIGSPDQVIQRAAAYADAGVRYVDMRLINRTLDDILRMMELFAAEVMPSFN